MLREPWTRPKEKEINMEITATQKFIRLSPRKVRPVVTMIKKMTPSKAVEILAFVGKRSAMPLAKVIKTAIANAAQQGIGSEDLKFKEIQIGEGPTLKRGTPVSRGRFHPIKKRMSHIRVTLTTLKDEPKKLAKPEVKKGSELKKVSIVKPAVKKVAKKTVKKGSK